MTLFAAVGLLIGGIDDLAVDLLFFARAGWRRLRPQAEPSLADLPPPSGRIAVLIPAWDESAVIGAMLRTALARWADLPVRLYVGAYPNDWETIEAIAEVAEHDRRVRLVVGARAGPTTKADCLNALWRALLSDEAHEGRAFAAIALHDAEDVVHPGELAVFAHCLARFDAVQLPVLPLPHPGSSLIGGTYLDEFAEAHAKQLVVRQAVGAGLPFAGVGCAIRRDMLARIAEARGGTPFDAASLTEDYEMGLAVTAMGGRTVLANVPEAPGGLPVAVRALFPGRLDAAVRQKARWMTGIALAGWDRTGWGHVRHVFDHWMRMRDRRAPIAVAVLTAAYLALLLWAVALAAPLAGLPAPELPARPLAVLLVVNAALLGWRLAIRVLFTARVYGAREAMLAVPRMFVGNLIALVAARRALFAYLRLLRGGQLRWDKTAHQFPENLGAAR